MSKKIDLYLKIELDLDEDEKPEKIAQEICRQAAGADGDEGSGDQATASCVETVSGHSRAN